MTKQQIDDLLCDLNFSEAEIEAFINILEYTKECQQSNTIENLKSYIEQHINTIVKDED